MGSNKSASMVQEMEIARFLGGKVQSNSGGTKFGGGDVHTDQFLIEAKTHNAPQHSFTIKNEFLIKAQTQAFEQGKRYWALAFRCDPEGPDYFVIDKWLFKLIVGMLEEEGEED